MRIRIINLASSPDRLAFQAQQFQSLGLSFERLEAQTTSDFNQAQYQAAGFNWERPLSQPEYACYLSHKKAWLDVISADEPTLILEDDACISQCLPAFLDAVEARTYCDFITLEARRRKKVIAKSGVEVTSGISLHRLYLDRSGAAAYILWPEGAKKLLSLESQRGAALADAQICRAFSLRAYQAKPALVVQADCATHYHLQEPFEIKSTIWNGPRTLAPVQSKRLALRFKVNRILSQLRMAGRILLTILPSIERTLPSVDASHFKVGQ